MLGLWARPSRSFLKGARNLHPPSFPKLESLNSSLDKFIQDVNLKWVSFKTAFFFVAGSHLIEKSRTSACLGTKLTLDESRVIVWTNPGSHLELIEPQLHGKLARFPVKPLLGSNLHKSPAFKWDQCPLSKSAPRMPWSFTQPCNNCMDPVVNMCLCFFKVFSLSGFCLACKTPKGFWKITVCISERYFQNFYSFPQLEAAGEIHLHMASCAISSNIHASLSRSRSRSRSLSLMME